MKFYKSVNCHVIWKCYGLNEEITVNPDAVYNVKKGWLCDCGEWVKNSSRSHEILLMGLREGVKPENKDKIKISTERSIKCVCCECENTTDKEINGVYICKECYDYDYDAKYGYKSYVPNDFVTALGLMILNCSIEFNPDLIICRDCNFFRDCNINHVLIDSKMIKNEIKLDDFGVHS